ncbi:insulinase family protein [Sphingobacteriales bacterium CHB3]|nr:insulinase family protein [Sphingobacteriales bacterium CHB3]
MKFLSVTLTLLMLGVCMTAFTQELDRTIRPKAQGVPRVDLPDIQKATLKNGLKVWLVEARELPLVAMNLVFQTGSDHDPANRAVLASMTADMLDEGTKTRNALQIAEELDFIGANLGVNAFTDGSSMTLNCMTKHLDKALAIYADVLVNPTFPEKEFERLRQQRLTALLQQKDRAATIATLSFNKIIYGNDHPYGRNAAGDETSIAEMKREDLLKFYESYYRPNNATLIIVGDAKLKDIVKKLDPLLASWKAARIPSATIPVAPAIDKRMVYLIDKQGAPQSEIRIGFPAIARNSPDFFAVNLMNRALGGQFASRLNLNLREKRGYTYGARSSFSFNKQAGPFTASAGVTTSKTDSSLHEFFYEIDRTQKDGITAEELDFVKKGLSGNFALTFETPAQIAGALQNIVLYNLPENYYEMYLQNIDKVTLDDIKRVSGKYLNSSRMAVVVVGDLSIVKDGIEALRLGEIVMCDLNGNKLSQ